MAEPKTYECPTLEIKVYLGSHIGYTQAVITEGTLRALIWQYQQEHQGQWQPPLRMTRTQYLYNGGCEPGWEITGVAYPPAPPTTVGATYDYMEGLARRLQQRLVQRRVTIVGPHITRTLEDPDVQPPVRQ